MASEQISPFRSRKGERLLTLLVLAAPRAVPRDRITDLLWPESDFESAGRNLRQCLWSLRKELGSHSCLIQSPTSRSLQFDLSDTDIDVTEFDRAAARNDRESLLRAISLYRGHLLESYLELWLTVERENRQCLMLRALRLLACDAETRECWDEALEFRRRAAALAPFDESVLRALMRTAFHAGQSAIAMDFFHSLSHKMKALDPAATPSNETLFEYRRICSAAAL